MRSASDSGRFRTIRKTLTRCGRDWSYMFAMIGINLGRFKGWLKVIGTCSPCKRFVPEWPPLNAIKPRLQQLANSGCSGMPTWPGTPVPALGGRLTSNTMKLHLSAISTLVLPFRIFCPCKHISAPLMNRFRTRDWRLFDHYSGEKSCFSSQDCRKLRSELSGNVVIEANRPIESQVRWALGYFLCEGIK